MVIVDDKLCKGCICRECKKSGYNGAVHSCPLRRCDTCDDEGICKLQSCTTFQARRERETDDLRL